MRYGLSLALFAIAAVAAPTPQATEGGAESLLASLSSLNLSHDDVILFGVNGQYKIVKDAEFHNLTSTGALTYGGNDKVDARDISEPLAALETRDCPGLNSEFTVTSTANFLDWDIQMSAVWGAQQAPVTIAVAHGHSVANQVSFGGDIGFPIKAISLGLNIDYTKTWTTTDTTTITYTVPQGYYGTVISQPWTHRVYGNVYTSCTTDNWQKTTFMASSHTSQNYGGMEWVTGVLRLCASKDYPVPYCEGSGYHY
ncbi:uncharacterized protein ColSpa_01676 [Colletotrichum spaethianum]|uniref:Celp0028 effector like protein n=1 Tax=Colletotrichum spaethianum TaxID=700344 RepID=A0AA37NWM0_9PEZI|nr:uncharacterized protein ColSpa_01676 [Colletotrichum spaethianum]GKT41495.1 hypothetical protein ColSpa_01676 [Colletotrichum spaethianum]